MQSNPSILVVEDDPLDQELIEGALRAAAREARIFVVGGGRQAIGYLNGEGEFSDRVKYPYPNLIITDLKMPDGDGLAVLEFLKSNPTLSVIPTVMYSSSRDENDVSTAYRLGASSYIAKPAKKAEMDARMKSLIEYWTFCEAPKIAISGRHVKTDSRGKLGERFEGEDK